MLNQLPQPLNGGEETEWTEGSEAEGNGIKPCMPSDKALPSQLPQAEGITMEAETVIQRSNEQKEQNERRIVMSDDLNYPSLPPQAMTTDWSPARHHSATSSPKAGSRASKAEGTETHDYQSEGRSKKARGGADRRKLTLALLIKTTVKITVLVTRQYLRDCSKTWLPHGLLFLPHMYRRCGRPPFMVTIPKWQNLK